MEDVRELHLLALPVAEASGDLAAIATVENYLASAYGRAGQHEEAEEHLGRSIRLYAELGDRSALSKCYDNLGLIHFSRGRFRESAEALQQALRNRAGLALRYSPMAGLATLVDSLAVLGRYDEAIAFLRRGLFVMIDVGNDAMVGSSFLRLQRLRIAQGTMAPATAHRYVDAGTRLVDRAGYQAGLADARNDRARLYRLEGRYLEALAEHRQALKIIQPLNDLLHETMYRCDLGATLRAAGDLPEAHEAYREALVIARRLRSDYQIARALSGLAACLADGDPEAERFRAQAGELFQRMGVSPDGR